MAASFFSLFFLWLITFHIPPPPMSPLPFSPPALCTQLPIGCTLSSDWLWQNSKMRGLGFDWPEGGRQVVVEEQRREKGKEEGDAL